MKKILAVIFSIMMIMGLTGCQNNGPEGAVKELFGDIKKFDVEQFKSKYDDSYSDLIDAKDDIGLTEEEIVLMYEEIFKNIKYEIKDVELTSDGDSAKPSEEKKDASEKSEGDSNERRVQSAVVSVKVTNIDMSDAMREYIDTYFSLLSSKKEMTEKEIDRKAAETLKKAVSDTIKKGKTKTWEYDIVVYKVDGEWVADVNEDLYSSITGGLFQDEEDTDSNSSENEGLETNPGSNENPAINPEEKEDARGITIE